MTNPQFHSIVLDGVYGGPPHAPGPFLPLPPPELEDVTRVMAGTARRVMRLLEKRGIDNEDDPKLAASAYRASVATSTLRPKGVELCACAEVCTNAEGCGDVVQALTKHRAQKTPIGVKSMQTP